MNNLEVFNFESKEVRTKSNNNGDVWFCLKDVCEILELEQVSRVKSRLNQDGVTTGKVIDSLGREQEVNFINESNWYGKTSTTILVLKGVAIRYSLY